MHSSSYIYFKISYTDGWGKGPCENKSLPYNVSAALKEGSLFLRLSSPPRHRALTSKETLMLKKKKRLYKGKCAEDKIPTIFPFSELFPNMRLP
jgi:hypothetical protein